MSASDPTDYKPARLLQCILDSMGDGVVVADSRGKFVLFNPAAERILGKGARDTEPECWSQEYGCFLPDGVTPYPPHELPLARAMRGETVNGVRLFIRHAGKPEGVWVNVTGRPLVDEDRGGGVVVLRDITGIKRGEEALQTARQDAESANRAKSEFLSRMSHELRTPLNAILGFGQLLEIDDLRPAQQESVEQILKGGRHLLRLINEVLDIARIEAGKLALSTEPVEVADAISSAVELIRPLAKQRAVSLRVQPSPALQHGFLLADRQRVQQVLLNLLSNAIKYNRAGGKVEVSVAAVGDHMQRIAVRDTGLGIAADDLRRLFNPFERLNVEDTELEGSGIGLALSKRLVEAMAGSVGVESEVGRGSTFWIELPSGEAPVEHYKTELEDAPGGPPGSPVEPSATVLYIEDNPSNNLLMQRILANRPGIKLISAIQGTLGLELARQHRPDLILLDLHLPDVHGSMVLQRLAASPVTSAIPVAILSADATPGQIERLTAAGARAYFTKPVEVKALLGFVDELLAAGARV